MKMNTVMEVPDKEGTVVQQAEAEFTLPPPEATSGAISSRLALLVLLITMFVLFI